MSTQAMIARKVAEGYECIYVCWDGYLKGVGLALLNTFNGDNEVNELFALGDCSTIAGAASLNEVEAYHRDMDENWDACKPQTFADLGTAGQVYGPSYTYIWENETWRALHLGDEVVDWNK